MKNVIILGIVLSGLFISLALKSNPEKIEKFHQDDSDIFLTSVAPPPDAYTGAPGENYCYQCHAQGGLDVPAAGNINYSFSGTNDEYLPNQTYNIELSIPNNAKNGFELTILDANNLKAGSLNASTGAIVSNSNGKEYIKHQDAYNNAWQFQWTAPSSDMGDLTVYYNFNKTNDDFGIGGDTVYVGQETILSGLTTEITESNPLKDLLRVSFDQNNNTLKLEFETLDNSNVSFQLYDMQGRLIVYQDYGVLAQNTYSKIINLSEQHLKGAFVLNLMIDNYAIKKRIAFR